MISMTGYGRGQADGPMGSFVVELRSVNHRFCDISARIPHELYPLEHRIKRYIGERVSRGRVNLVILRPHNPAVPEVSVNTGLACGYVEALRRVGEELGVRDDLGLSSIASLPDVVSTQRPAEDEEALWETVRFALDEALAALGAMREAEGGALAEDIAGRIDTIERELAEVKLRVPQIVADYKERLEARIAELAEGVEVDESRLAGEVAFFADRSDVAEEITRLESHIAEFRKAMDGPDSVGRMLDFSLQEMGREVNTIGAKAGDSDVRQSVIALKAELEKVREQVQNVE